MKNQKNQLFLPIFNQQITKVWRGYAAVIFLELGQLSTELKHSVKGDYSSEKGEFTIMIEGKWVLKKGDKELLNSDESSYQDIDKTLNFLVNLKIIGAQFDQSTDNFILQIDEDYLLEIIDFKNNRLTIFRGKKNLFELGK